MSVWSTCVMTNKGLALQSKLIAGNTLTITKAVVGSGYVNPDNLRSQTDVSNQKQTLTFREVSYPSEGKCSLPCRLSNAGVTTAYTAYQVGIYAYDPDDGEILYFIAQAESGSGSEVPTASASPGYVAEWVFYFQYGQADNVELSVSPSDTVTVAMMETEMDVLRVQMNRKADDDLSNVSSSGFKEAALRSHSTDIVAWTSGAVDGPSDAYAVLIEGLSMLYVGLTITIIPHETSESVSPLLYVNDLGAHNIRQRLSTNTATSTTGEDAAWLKAGKPVSMTFDGSFWLVNMARQSAANLYGNVPINKGGFGGSTAEEALENLGINALIANLPNLYVWSKWSTDPGILTSAYQANFIIAFIGDSFQYADSVTVSDGIVQLTDPKTFTFATPMDDYGMLVGKYVTSETGEIYTIMSNATITLVDDVKIVASYANKIYCPAEKYGYVASFNENAYPNDGVYDSIWYTYKKQLGD